MATTGQSRVPVQAAYTTHVECMPTPTEARGGGRQCQTTRRRESDRRRHEEPHRLRHHRAQLFDKVTQNHCWRSTERGTQRHRPRGGEWWTASHRSPTCSSCCSASRRVALSGLSVATRTLTRAETSMCGGGNGGNGQTSGGVETGGGCKHGAACSRAPSGFKRLDDPPPAPARRPRAAQEQNSRR